MNTKSTQPRGWLSHTMILLVGIMGFFSFLLYAFLLLLLSYLTDFLHLPYHAAMAIGGICALFGVSILIFLYAKKSTRLPANKQARFLPVLFPLFFYAVFFALANLISDGFFGHTAFIAMMFSAPGLWPATIIASLMGAFHVIIYGILAQSVLVAFFFWLGERKNPSHITTAFSCKWVVGCSLFLTLFFFIGAVVQISRGGRIVHPRDYGFEYAGGYSSVDIYQYDIQNPQNQLPELLEKSTFHIDQKQDMPILDGAEAAYPVYSAFANVCYDHTALKAGSTQDQSSDVVTFTNTIYAFERLLSGEVDIFFGATPSKAQMELAQSKGIELVITPIGKDAFVFLVSQAHDVKELTSEQIRDIYCGKIKDWNQLGGRAGKIWAYQRPEDSGSQTMMQHFMGDTRLIAPLKEEMISGMEGVYEKIADYGGQPGGIGYSFRFFSTMQKAKGAALVTLDGIDPTKENIASGAYPMVASLVAISRADTKKSTVPAFVEWMTGAQGQELVEKVGYVSFE